MELNIRQYSDGIYAVFRVIVGLLFLHHGLQKIFINGVSFASMMGVAGVVEIVVGVLLVIGLFTQIGAILGFIQMVVAYIMVHIPNGLLPLNNGGEAATLFAVAFLVIMAWGGGKYSVDMKRTE